MLLEYGSGDLHCLPDSGAGVVGGPFHAMRRGKIPLGRHPVRFRVNQGAIHIPENGFEVMRVC